MSRKIDSTFIPYSRRNTAVFFVVLLLLGVGGFSYVQSQSQAPGTNINNNIVLDTPVPTGGDASLQLRVYYPPTNTPTPTSPPQTASGTSTPVILTSPPKSTSGKLGWSSGYYPGWLQNTYPPAALPWKGLTYLIQFSVMSNTDGSIRTTAHSLTPAHMQAAVAEAHKQHVKILISIGGDDDNNWEGACSSASRATFVNNLVKLVQTYGYDGIDLDIERDFGYPAHTDYIACVRDLRVALDTISPRPTLTTAGDPSWQAYMISQIAQYVDQINLMSYRTTASGMGAELNNYTSRGIPKNKLGIGLGVGAGGIDNDGPSCGAKAKYAVDNSYGGIMEFVITEDMANHNGQTPCFDAIAPYIP